MNTFIKIIFYIGFFFFGSGFLIEFGEFIAYNGLGDIFEYIKPEKLETRVEVDSLRDNKTVFYTYVALDKKYESKQSVQRNRITEHDFYETNVFYNKTIPSLSYVGKKELKQRGAVIGMIIFGFFFLLFFLIYKFADMEKWIGVYTRGEYKSSRK